MSQPHNRHALRILHWVENIGLIVILLATLVASFQELQVMVMARKVTLTDLLLLFLYLEIFTMLGLYYRQGKLPVMNSCHSCSPCGPLACSSHCR